MRFLLVFSPIFCIFASSNKSFHQYAKQQRPITHSPFPANDVCGPHGARTTVFPLHPATFSLAQAQSAAARGSRPHRVRPSAPPHLPAQRGRDDLSAPRPSVNYTTFCPPVHPLSAPGNSKQTMGFLTRNAWFVYEKAHHRNPFPLPGNLHTLRLLCNERKNNGAFIRS